MLTKKFCDLVNEVNTKNEIDYDKNLQNIIFDTNFLFITFQFKIDLIDEIKRVINKKSRFFIYKSTLDELDNLSQKKSKSKKYLPLIYKMLKIYDFTILNNNDKNFYVDNLILKNLDKKDIIATNDKDLRKKIKQKNKEFKILFLRQKSYLVLE